MYFNYDNLEFRYEPFPIGLARPLIEPGLYREFLANYPPQDRFKYLAKLGHKYSLSEHFDPKAFERFLRENPLWNDFNRWIKSRDFVRGVLQALAERSLDLGYDADMTFARQLRKRLTHAGRLNWSAARLQSRFEFSMLPADGGHILPHTDSPSKVVTLVVSMIDEGEWDPAFGGGTDVNQARNIRRNFNQTNVQGRFEDMEVIDTFEFTPNQAVLFVRTFNSWHSVRPMTGKGSAAMRKTLTINIEAFT
jgi:hypothetical protein